MWTDKKFPPLKRTNVRVIDKVRTHNLGAKNDEPNQEWRREMWATHVCKRERERKMLQLSLFTVHERDEQMLSMIISISERDDIAWWTFFLSAWWIEEMWKFSDTSLILECDMYIYLFIVLFVWPWLAWQWTRDYLNRSMIGLWMIFNWNFSTSHTPSFCWPHRWFLSSILPLHKIRMPMWPTICGQV